MSGLVLTDVTHRYQETPVVEGVNLAVGPGEIVCLLGPSGSGKSTLLRLAAGLEELQSGAIELNGATITPQGPPIPPEQRSVGLIFQDYALFPHLPVVANVAFGLRGMDRYARLLVAAEALERIGMSGFAAAYPHTLSGGEQQRVALARALATKPKVMLMDEPFSGLDVRLRDTVRDQTLQILRRAGTATLLVTHDPEDAMGMADRIVLIRQGRVVQTGTPEDLFYRPADAFTARFFSEINTLHGVVENGSVATPLGALAADGLADGAAVEVLIRPTDLRVEESGVPAALTQARLMGADSLLDVALEGGGPALRLRVAGAVLPKVGSILRVALNPDRCFIFNRSPTDST